MTSPPNPLETHCSHPLIWLVELRELLSPVMQAIERPQKTAQRKRAPTKRRGTILPAQVVSELERHVLVDGFKLVFDAEKSQGSRLVDAVTGREFIDLFGFYASQPIGFKHRHFERPEVQAELLAAAKVKVANPDVYSVQYATFVQTFS